MMKKCEHDSIVVDAGGVSTCKDCQATKRSGPTAPWMPEIGIHCKHDHITVEDGGAETCDDCHMTKRNGGDVWIVGTQCISKCTHERIEYHQESGQPDQCLECGAKRYQKGTVWHPLMLKCSDCRTAYHYKGEFPLPDDYKRQCPKCFEEKSEMACKCSGCTEITGVPPEILQGNEVFCPDCIPRHCKHDHAVQDEQMNRLACPDCGKIRSSKHANWHGQDLTCSDCNLKFEYHGRWPIPDFYQPRCPSCLKKVAGLFKGRPFRATNGSGILCDWQIKERVESGIIRIDPYDPKCVQPASYDLHLGTQFKIYRVHAAEIIDTKKPIDHMLLDIVIRKDEVFILHPQYFALGLIAEITGVDSKHVGRLEGKSSLARMGLLIHTTAGFLDPGNSLKLTLELFNVSPLPIKLYPGMPIAQIAFEEMQEVCEKPYDGLYKDVDHVQGSLIHKSFGRYDVKTGFFNQRV